MLEDNLCSHYTKLEVLSQKSFIVTEQVQVTYTLKGYYSLYLNKYKTAVT